MNSKISCGRFAPSPTGRMHFGNIYSATLSWLIARKSNGNFVLRFEDIDKRSNNASYKDAILDDLQWLGIDWDKDPLIQLTRFSAFEKAFEKIKAKTFVYPCFCCRADLHAASAPHASDGTLLYAGTCKKLMPEQVRKYSESKNYAYRLEVPDMVISFEDNIQGIYKQNLASECGDFILQRSDGIYAYQLAVVVDDAYQGVTQVCRGADLLSSTPRQIYLASLLNLDSPDYFHHPVLLAKDKKRLSKRNKSCDMSYLRKMFSSQDLLGWVAFYAGQLESPKPLTLLELLDLFCVEKIPKESAIIADAFLDAL